MYHFSADHPPDPVRLSFRALIPGHIRQYIKDFQLDAIRFMHNFLANGEFCVYNDESGLGKQAAVVVLLDAACSSRKCLIVVQNDDRYVTGWEFHFNVLTNTHVTVIKDENYTTDSPHSIYIAKWSTLRTIDDLSKYKFDFVILDNRGQMLNNSFCTSMLLKHYERKINILISSVDITSDLKLLHNVLRLGGRLEAKYSSFKTFDEKFKLPDAKELAYKRVDLEEYFCKRERLADYCKEFRLRRYCHQYETHLPLVKEDRYKINLELWREKQNATNSESSSIAYVNNQNREDEHIKDTQELFEEYCRQRRKQHLQFQQEEEQRLHRREREMLRNLETEKEIIYNVDDEIALINDTPPLMTEKPPAVRDNSDEAILMSPLLVESDSDADDIPEICNDSFTDVEIVDLSSEEKEEDEVSHNQTNGRIGNNKKGEESCATNEKGFKIKRKSKKRSEVDRLQEDIADTLKIKKPSIRLSRHTKSKDRSKQTTNIINNKRPHKSRLACSENTNLKDENKSSEVNAASKNILEHHSKENCTESPERPKVAMKESGTIPRSTKKFIEKNTSVNSSSVEKGKTIGQENINKIEINDITDSRKTRSMKNLENTSKESSIKINDHPVAIKQEDLEQTPPPKKVSPKHFQAKVNSEKLHLKRNMQLSPLGTHPKTTRSMQRLTRSASAGRKYFSRNLSLHIDKTVKPKKVSSFKASPKSAEKNKERNKDTIKQDEANKMNKNIENKNKNSIKNTQASIISHRSSQDYESLQCAQRLSDASVFDNDNEKATEFLVPPTPNSILRNSLLPSSLTSSVGLLAESDVVFITPSNTNVTTNRKRDQVILLSSSDNENTTSQSSSTNAMTSRRTRALKPKRNQQQPTGGISNAASFSDLITQKNTRTSTKSPDLFSNCSDLIQMPCTQPNLESAELNTPFEGFKIFGSEVKQLQQHYAFNESNINKHNVNAKKSYREQRSCLDILEKMFEPPNRKSKQQNNEKPSTPTKKTNHAATPAIKEKSHTQILPFHPIEAITEARQKRESQKRKQSTPASSSALQVVDDIFEITNNGTFGSVMRLHSNGDISPVQNTQKANAKQHNKITNYLIGNVMQNSSQEEITPNSGNSTGNLNTEAGTPSKRLSNMQNTNNMKKSPKGKCNTTQATKLTKWFTKPSELNNHEINLEEKSSNSKKTTKKLAVNKQMDHTSTTVSSSPPPATGKRILKRRRLDLSFNK